jgi:glycosyltransferase involved in cell wall biosynthesis
MSRSAHSPLSVWYIAAGYKLPAGIEAYLLHYATELRNQGFDPRIVVFEPLPKVPHRFLVALRERGIPIESLYERVSTLARVLAWASYMPWMIRQWRRPQPALHSSVFRDGAGTTDHRPQTKGQEGGGNSHLTSHISRLTSYWLKRLAVRELKRMIEREKPDVIHVKGRLITEAWPVFPSERTIYQHALMGTRDPSWEECEAEAFSVFLNRVARVLVQGKGIAETFAKSFNINRPIDVVFTMAPDEAGGLPPASSDHRPQTIDRKEGEADAAKSNVDGRMSMVYPKQLLRYGILCRFTEQKGISYILEALKMYKEKHGAVDFTFAGQGPMESLIRDSIETIDHRPQTIDQNAGSARLETNVNGLGTNASSPLGSIVYGLRSEVSAPRICIVPVESAVKVLEQLDVFVHPGLDDAMPVSVVEALMCGVPCIVSNVGASPELVRDGVEGLVIEPASAEQILAAMERFASMTADELTAYKARARERYQEVCRPEVVGAQVAGLYWEVRGM